MPRIIRASMYCVPRLKPSVTKVPGSPRIRSRRLDSGWFWIFTCSTFTMMSPAFTIPLRHADPFCTTSFTTMLGGLLCVVMKSSPTPALAAHRPRASVHALASARVRALLSWALPAVCGGAQRGGTHKPASAPVARGCAADPAVYVGAALGRTTLHAQRATVPRSTGVIPVQPKIWSGKSCSKSGSTSDEASCGCRLAALPASRQDRGPNRKVRHRWRHPGAGGGRDGRDRCTDPRVCSCCVR